MNKYTVVRSLVASHGDWHAWGGFPPGTFKNSEIEVSDEDAAKMRARLAESVRKREPLVYGRDWDYTPITVPPLEETVSIEADLYSVSGEGTAHFYRNESKHAVASIAHVLSVTLEGTVKPPKVGDAWVNLHTDPWVKELREALAAAHTQIRELKEAAQPDKAFRELRAEIVRELDEAAARFRELESRMKTQPDGELKVFRNHSSAVHAGYASGDYKKRYLVQADILNSDPPAAKPGTVSVDLTAEELVLLRSGITFEAQRAAQAATDKRGGAVNSELDRKLYAAQGKLPHPGKIAPTRDHEDYGGITE